MPNDMENYTEYRVMGSVSQIRMRADCLPLKFGCQPDIKRRTDIRSLPAKRQKLKTIEEYEREIEQVKSKQRFSMAEVQPGPSSDKNAIKRSLPMAFRHKYHHVSCIIDCLEIEIQKPSNAVHQALTWSDYKKANTLKYLISSTPDDLVNFISPGYGGRTSDVCEVEHATF
ncbi:hypothetical protein EVAR_10341_1 [Eumeta japonica]|uniref:DDE Tnp4 domain-containing protein n=1 Tax=Eumeta variegata TaxID=151549 RepID=A0A4C1THE6_EUMVA|nr:hypothetical protein EVAR_10341_1 [Eumeta japonica]